ncbi:MULTISPECIES: 23S rRNA (cytidine(2498)-2'-O)-methyltransferase RlmM [unclassified Motilimonas]|uniref:23S rRNA (cytidine(2498)-2'-O)-methyltransferase RlmM n=1 Tax=Motilimonas TaxID=1914248 RepID=UPI001E2D8CDF|nr:MULTISPECIES: 23S rRNA (cytidine(2498)-2'-O)-methyltransferase RlmM [unclassified Motilimonas]MCE0556061.1 23S rRNA (cytidine(2498)-2'-O)-methyltransferase RlmM [Motilimonas sp. E26]MDO6527813.1 23S rRNA (cytidine(2498)-2'-O)-methyltransferase RlmM [Motilimonas sp. 1_MG-2023]
MKGLLLYCRPGFESDCAAEIQDQAALLDCFGFVKTQSQSGYVYFECYDPSHAEILIKQLNFFRLVFARQMIAVSELVSGMDVNDRITPILAAAQSLPLGGDIWVETPEGDETKPLLTFCRKFTVPLRAALRKANKITAKEQGRKPRYHVCFLDNQTAYLGYSITYNSSPFYMGIARLKFPNAAPSRSTLKLDEAIQLFIPKEEQETRLAPGMKAVDLGACPGGWTYQLVRRGMFVAAVDNGQIAQSLMDTGQVKYYADDGFKFQPFIRNLTWLTGKNEQGKKVKYPEHTHVNWLVCDMIEKPHRVAKLMADWLEQAYCREAIFNLKLPMKRRYYAVKECLDMMTQRLGEDAFDYQVKHLYHDREEVTVHVRWKDFSK